MNIPGKQNRIKNRFKRIDNRGLTLVELICSIAVFGLVATGVGGVMVVSAKNYQRGTNEIELQQEAQITANQIGDLVIDSTAEVKYTCSVGGSDVECKNEAEALSLGAVDGGDRSLRIEKSDKLYVVTYKSVDMKIMYSEYTINADGTYTTVATDMLMAENITVFKADVSRFADSGNLQLNLGLEKGGRSYASTFTITARNGLLASTMEEAAATITGDTDIVLEPSQAYELNATVVGPAETGVTWSMSGNTSANTLLATNPSTGKMEIKIGTDETASEIILLVKTVAKKADGVTPLAQQAVMVHIRRVTGVGLTATLTSGTSMNAGSEYLITAAVTGTNLDKVPATVYDIDYKPTRDVQWKYLFTKDGYEVGGPFLPFENPANYFEVIDSSEDGEGAACYTKIRLKTDMQNNLQLLVTAVAKHPDGTEVLPIGGTRDTNKTGIAYGNIYGTYLFFKNYYNFDGDKINRGSDVPQGNFSALDTIKQMMINKYGNSIYQARKEYRFREILNIDAVTGERTYGPWTTWEFNPLNQEDNDINLRPVVTSRFECDRNYEVQIRLSMYDHTQGKIVWPDADTPPSAYMIDADIMRIKISFTGYKPGEPGTKWFDDQIGAGSQEAPLVLYKGGSDSVQYEFYYNNCVSIKEDNIRDKLKYVIQKYEGGAWVDAGDSALIHRSGDTCGSRFKDNGLYRILLRAEGVPYTTYNSATGIYSNVSRDYNLWDETTGEGIFYFKVE